MRRNLLLPIQFFTLTAVLAACGDNNGGSPTPLEPAIPESQLLLEQFGAAADAFNEEGMQALLNFEDQDSPVSVAQLISVTDAEGFAAYETEAELLWESVGGFTRFASTPFAQMVGERPMSEARIIEFPNITMLLDAIRNPAFTDLMNTLFTATDDHDWVLGIEQPLPFEAKGSYFDPDLLNLDREGALQALGIPPFFEPPAEVEPIIDMLVDDKPSPFWMVNFIAYREQAQYEDGRETDLTGREANDIYGNAILPQLADYNSFPIFTMEVDIVLTNEEVQWEQVAIPRYASRDAFLNIFILNPAGQEALVHKNAGVENTLVYATEVASETIAAPRAGPLFNFRYCEVLLAFEEPEGLRADVFNSMPISTCPQEDWDALDAESIASEFGADEALLNGIRFWVLDLIQSTSTDTRAPVIENFGGINMRLAASVTPPEGSGLGQEEGVTRYIPSLVSRDTIFHYAAGRQVYQLTDPDGVTYMMQSLTQGIDRDQQLEDLQRLGSRLDLHPGWVFEVRILTEAFQLPSVDGIAAVITDDLGNTYQRVP